MNDEILKNLLGDATPGHWIAAIIFASFGIAISLLISSRKRDKHSPETPFRFDFLFLITDNINRILLSMLLVFVTLRFSQELFGANFTMYFALGVGLGLDRLSANLQANGADFLLPKRKRDDQTN